MTLSSIDKNKILNTSLIINDNVIPCKLFNDFEVIITYR